METKKHETKAKAKKKNFRGIESAFLVIVACFIIALCIFHFILGNPANFMVDDPTGHPLPGNMLGTIYKGGVSYLSFKLCYIYRIGIKC